MEKILICGISGQLGGALREAFKNDSVEIYGTYNRATPPNKDSNIFHLTITNQKEIKEALDRIKPDIVINTVAMTNVDCCEIDKERAWAINVQGNRNLLNACNKSVLFIFISTYYVFDGKTNFYTELDSPNPLNYYAKTKLDAEKDCLERGNSLIIRPSKIYSLGYENRNFIARLYLSLMKKELTKQITDQYTNPVLADDLARIIVELISQNKTGIYNVGGLNYLGNYDFAVKFATFFGFNKELISPSSSDKLRPAARRPKNCGLNVQKLLDCGIRPLTLNESFLRIKKKIENNPK